MMEEVNKVRGIHGKKIWQVDIKKQRSKKRSEDRKTTVGDN